MKKLVVLIFCLLFLLTASACGEEITQNPNDSSLQTGTEEGVNLVRSLTGYDDLSALKGLSIIHKDGTKTTHITDEEDWAFLENYFLAEVVTFAQKENLITTKTNLLKFGFSEADIYLLNDGSIIKQEMCGDSGVPQEDRRFEIYKAEEKYMLNEEKLITLLKKYNEDKTTVIKSRLPEVKFSAKDSDVKFTDIINLPNGGFAVSGHRYTEIKNESIIQIYDKNATLEKEYAHYDSNGFNKIALCSDGGFVAASYYPPYITKVNSNFETEWFMPYKNCETSGTVHDIEEISSEVIAVLFVSVDSTDFSRRLKISYLNKEGSLIETVDLMKNVDPQDADIIADGNGGFYLLSTCNKELAEKFPLVAEQYNNSKATEAIMMHFSAKRELVWVKTLGGGGDDWIEEATIDSNGNFYLAVGTNWYGADSFWEMGVERTMPYRRMLVKLDKNGDLVYKVPLSAKGMAVDHIFGIHIKDSKAYVVGMTDYFDGYQIKYPCEQILPEEKQKGESISCVFNACIDNDGKELDRKIFRCDMNNEPCDSALLPNGTLVIAGSVSADANPFNLKFPLGVDASAALFIYK